MKNLFYTTLSNQQKGSNTVRIDDEKYTKLINSVIAAKRKRTGRAPEEYRLLKRYDVVDVFGTTKLIRPLTGENLTVQYFVKYSEIFDVL